MYYYRPQATFTRKSLRSLPSSDDICQAIYDNDFEKFKVFLNENMSCFNARIIDVAAVSSNLEFIHYIILSSDSRVLSVLKTNAGYVCDAAMKHNKPLCYAIIRGVLETSLGETDISTILSLSDQAAVAHSEDYARHVIDTVVNKPRHLLGYRGWDFVTDRFEAIQQCISLNYSYETYYPLMMDLFTKADRRPDSRQYNVTCSIFRRLLTILLSLSPDHFKDKECHEKTDAVEGMVLSPHQILKRLCDMIETHPDAIVENLLSSETTQSPNRYLLEHLILSRAPPPVSSKWLIKTILEDNEQDRFLRCPVGILQHLVSNVDEQWETVVEAIQHQYRRSRKKLKNFVAGKWFTECYRRFVALNGIKFVHAPRESPQCVSLTLIGMARQMTGIKWLVQDILSGNVTTHLHYLPDNLVQNLKMILMIRQFESTILSLVPNELIFEVSSHFLVF